MRRKILISFSALAVLLIIAGVMAEVMYLRRQRDDPSPAFSEVNGFLDEAKFLQQFPAGRGWSLDNTEAESFTWGRENRELHRIRYAFQDRSGKLVIILLTRDGQRIVRFQVIGAPEDEEAFRKVLLEKFPPLAVAGETLQS